MAEIAVIGERHRVQAVAVAGAVAHPAATPKEAVEAWERLPAGVAVLVLTREAAAALGRRTDERRDLLVTVMP